MNELTTPKPLAPKAIGEFISSIAVLAKDGECAACLQDASEPNRTCPEHQPFELTNDDAVDTLHGLIDEARAINAAQLTAWTTPEQPGITCRYHGEQPSGDVCMVCLDYVKARHNVDHYTACMMLALNPAKGDSECKPQ